MSSRRPDTDACVEAWHRVAEKSEQARRLTVETIRRLSDDILHLKNELVRVQRENDRMSSVLMHEDERLQEVEGKLEDLRNLRPYTAENFARNRMVVPLEDLEDILYR